jgi:hypothetical protein
MSQNSHLKGAIEPSTFPAAMWKHRLWWMLPLGVLILLLVGIYALEHLSKTDSEMYPTSAIQCPNHARLC